MSGRYLLDTNVAIRILNNQIDLEERRDPGVAVFLSVTVVGELLFGAEKSDQPEANRSLVERLIDVCPVVPQNVDTARLYGSVKKRLQQKGRPIPENDIWIAAAALQYGLTVATDDAHFAQVEDLAIESW